MPPGTPYFDLLDDPLVQLVIRAFPKGHVNSCGRNLSATCRRMCTLVSGPGVRQPGSTTMSGSSLLHGV
jgi:hypothetical protein